jgi:hypothetical protein
MPAGHQRRDVGAPADEQPASGCQLGALRQARREAAHRMRRMIFNNDGDDVIYTTYRGTPATLGWSRSVPRRTRFTRTASSCTSRI